MNKRFIQGFFVGVVFVLGANFVYHNIIVPWPYREELKACLEDARALEDEEVSASAEDTCFRTYPHFL